MLQPLFALWQGHWQSWGFADWAAIIVAVAAICALVFVALKKFEVKIPDWVVQVFWIVVVAFVVIAAIRFVASM